MTFQEYQKQQITEKHIKQLNKALVHYEKAFDLICGNPAFSYLVDSGKRMDECCKASGILEGNIKSIKFIHNLERQ